MNSNETQRQIERLRWQSRLQMCALAPPAVGGLAASLTVRELIVVDDAHVARVRISGDVPDAVIDGRRLVRAETAAGLITLRGSRTGAHGLYDLRALRKCHADA